MDMASFLKPHDPTSTSFKLFFSSFLTSLGLHRIEESDGKPLQYSCLENPMNSMEKQNDRILKEELPRSVGAQYATGDQWRNNSRKNEGMAPKQNNTQLWM